MKLNLKYYPQHTDYSCGPACLRMVFEHLGKMMSETDLIGLCHTGKRFGTSHRHLVDAIKAQGFACLQLNGGHLNNLIACIDAGYFGIINYAEPFSGESHYAVVCGYTDDRREIILADPCNGFDYTIPWSELRPRWYGQRRSSRGFLLVIGRDTINLAS